MLSSYRIIKDKSMEKNEKPYIIPVLNIKTIEQETTSTKTDEVENAEREAENIILKAKVDAENTIRSAIEEANIKIEVIRKKAYDESYRLGYEQGEKDGYQIGFQTADKEGELIRKQARLILESAHKKAQEITDQNQSDIIELSVQIANKIMSATLSEDIEYIIKIAKDAVVEFKNKKQVIIYVNPSNLDIFERSLDEFLMLCPNISIVIMGDEKIGSTGCIIESDTLIIDTQVTSQLDQVRNALLEMRSKNE